ncbi:MAG: hypothetical protein KJI69_05285 [Patescibacteria group bacterium]|nr:hypothetical protein [Patescibacteria group bacterium]
MKLRSPLGITLDVIKNSKEYQLVTQTGSIMAKSKIHDEDGVTRMKIFTDELIEQGWKEERLPLVVLKERLDEIKLNYKDKRNKDIIRMRFGFENGKHHTLEETAHQFGITRERVRQIERRALDKVMEL